MNLPNWLYNPHLRRVLQRMQPDYTTIFGGRERELAELDAWLEDDANPYALLLAPTGRGKTALVWHWLERQQHEWQVIFVPISIRYGNSNQADVLAALTHAFAQLHGDLDEFSALQQTPSELQPKLAAYLRRDLPDDTRVLLAIDGLDEATGWELGADLLPENPPANLKILLSTRDMAQHQRADWYHKLGLQSEQTHDFTLGGLDRLALRELLIALGTPLDELAADFDVLGELLRVSAGDPVIVRLLVQLLREERIQIGQISQLPADDLNAVFALWLNQLSAQQSQLAQILLLLFANAYGPLSARDLLGLAPDHFADAEQIAHAIVPLARFVIGDAETGYVFSHQKLRELYRDRLDAQTLAEWNARFVNYGKQAYREPTPYLCRFLVNHLRDAGEWQFTRDLLADFSPQQHWAEARYALEGSYSGYLRDLELLQNWAIAQTDLALNIHCTLIKSSIVSITSNLSGELLAYLVTEGTTQGKWSVEAALAHIEQQPKQQNGKLLALLSAQIPIPWERAFAIVSQDSDLQDLAYMQLYQHVPPEFQATILEHLYQSLQNSQYVVAVPLLDFASELDDDWQGKLISCIFQAERLYSTLYERNWQAIFDATPPAWQAQMLNYIQTQIQPDLDKTKRQLQDGSDGYFYGLIVQWQILASEQQQISYWSDRIEIVLTNELNETMLSLLPAHELQAILELYRTIDINQHDRSRLSPYNFVLLQQRYLPHQTRLLDLAVELLCETPRRINHRLMHLLPQHYQQQLAIALLEQSQQTEHDVCGALIICLYYLPEMYVQLLETILQCIPKSYKGLHNTYYLQLMPCVRDEQRIEVIEQAWRAARNINSYSQQIELQIAFASLQPIEQFAETSQTLFSAINKCSNPVWLFEQLLRKRPDFSTLVYNAIISQETYKPHYSYLIEYFNPKQKQAFAQKLFDHLLATEQGMSKDIALYITNEQQQQAIHYIGQNPTTKMGLQMLQALLNTPNAAHQTLLPFVLAEVDSERRLYLLSDLLPHLQANQQVQLQLLIISTLYQMLEVTERFDYDLSAELLLVITNELLQNIEEHLSILCDLQDQQTPNEQQRISALIWEHLANNPAWPIDTLIENYELLGLCLPFFNSLQIQTTLEYFLEQTDLDGFLTLIPYLNAEQIEYLQMLTPEMGSSLLFFYSIAQEYHQILEQASYYQTLLAALHTQQRQYRDQWDFIQHLNEIAADLHPEDARALYLNSLNLLTTRYLEPESSWALYDAIEHFQRINFINQHTLTQFLHYASQQDRNSTLKILESIMPLYLQTLAPPEQQQLTQQITQSVEQVIVAWP